MISGVSLKTVVQKIVGWITGLVTGSSTSDRAAELEAERKKIEADAFSAGRYSPWYVLRYVLVAVFALYAIGVLVQCLYPDKFGFSVEKLNDLIKVAASILAIGGI